jgi:hypothetical protein
MGNTSIVNLLYALILRIRTHLINILKFVNEMAAYTKTMYSSQISQSDDYFLYESHGCAQV